jgi:hypothetical protein
VLQATYRRAIKAMNKSFVAPRGFNNGSLVLITTSCEFV